MYPQTRHKPKQAYKKGQNKSLTNILNFFIMANYIANAFSLQMLTLDEAHTIKVEPTDNFPSDSISVVGHPDTARILGVSFNRVNLKLKKGDTLYVAQLVGGRLPEGATTLPEGFRIQFVKVTLD